MCTVTWLYEVDGYHLFSNRDEKHLRGPACPPRLFDAAGVGYLAPVDPDRGGSWIAVNQFGVSICLLNGEDGGGDTSRGLLVCELAPARHPSHLLRRARLGRFAPFTLVVLEPSLPASVFQWDGRALTSLDSPPPLASSSLVMNEARRARAALFETMSPRSVAEFTAFHASHLPAPGPRSPCMHRPGAATVSFTHVHVAPDSIRMTYHPGPLCQAPPALTVQLPCSLHCSSHSPRWSVKTSPVSRPAF